MVDDSDLYQPFKFNSRLKDENFNMEENYKNIFYEWESHIKSEINNFKLVAGGVAVFFPKLKNLKAGSSKKAIQSAIDEICGNSQKVLEIYEHIRVKKFFPPASAINSE